MTSTSALALLAAALMASHLVGTPAANAQSNVLIGNATANDTQAAANEKLAELITEIFQRRLKASARHGQSLGTNAQMVAALQAGSIAGMVLPAGFISATVPGPVAVRPAVPAARCAGPDHGVRRAEQGRA